jgi:hypothetical protein
MNKKLVLLGILLLVGLTLSGCFLPPSHFGGRGYGYYDYSHGHDYGDHGDWDRSRHGSGHRPRHGR